MTHTLCVLPLLSLRTLKSLLLLKQTTIVIFLKILLPPFREGLGMQIMKKLLSTLFLALVASLGIIYASDTKVDGIWYLFDDSNKTATVTYRGSRYNSYDNEYSGSVVIPSSVTYNGTTYSVTSIGKYAFFGCSSLSSVTIGDSVTSIGDGAFRDCSSLTSVTIPNSMTSIGDDAFAGCSSLTSITIPNSVTSIGKYAFFSCSGLTSITIPNSVTSIEYHAFSGCSSLTSVTIPNTVTSIGEWAFSECSSLTSITCKATTPPILGSENSQSNVTVVYVPAESVEAYKTATNWSYYADKIYPIQ